MFTKILVATDLSHASDEMICILGSLKAVGAREALLVKCLNVRDVGGLAGKLTEEYQADLERQKKKLESLGFETRAEVVVGLPQIEIDRIAEENDCPLVVIGSRGETAFRELLLGSVASAVLHHSTRAVLVLRTNAGAAEGENPPCDPAACDFQNSVLFPTDFSDNAAAAFLRVQELAAYASGRITLLHVLVNGASPGARELAGSRLERLGDDLTKRGAKDVRIELVEGSAKKEVVKRAKDPAFSMVVIGSQGQGLISGAMLGSVSHAVAHHATVPVLFIPPRDGA